MLSEFHPIMAAKYIVKFYLLTITLSLSETETRDLLGYIKSSWPDFIWRQRGG